MTTDAPSPERVAVEQASACVAYIKDIGSLLRPGDRSVAQAAFSAGWDASRMATAQASDAEIERLKAEAQGLQYACGEHFNKAARADRRALAAEAESARLREELEPFQAIAKSVLNDVRRKDRHDGYPWVSRLDRTKITYGDLRRIAALAAGTSQEVGRG